MRGQNLCHSLLARLAYEMHIADIFGLARRMLAIAIGKGRTSSEAPDSHWSRERATWRFLDESEVLVGRACCLNEASAARSAVESAFVTSQAASQRGRS